MMRRILGLILAVLSAACAGDPAVKLGAAWPEHAGSYHDARDRWTRHAQARGDLSVVMDVYATLKAPDFRAAWVDESAKRLSMSAQSRDALSTAERTAADETWEVELIVATQKLTWQDFSAGHRSMWRLALEGDDGREVTPVSIKEDPRQRDELEFYYKGLTGLHRAYVVRFPRTADDGKPLLENGRRLRLKVAGAPGRVALEWKGE